MEIETPNGKPAVWMYQLCWSLVERLFKIDRVIAATPTRSTAPGGGEAAQDSEPFAGSRRCCAMTLASPGERRGHSRSADGRSCTGDNATCGSCAFLDRSHSESAPANPSLIARRYVRSTAVRPPRVRVKAAADLNQRRLFRSR
jgi:hypothetical protein